LPGDTFTTHLLGAGPSSPDVGSLSPGVCASLVGAHSSSTRAASAQATRDPCTRRGWWMAGRYPLQAGVDTEGSQVRALPARRPQALVQYAAFGWTVTVSGDRQRSRGSQRRQRGVVDRGGEHSLALRVQTASWLQRHRLYSVDHHGRCELLNRVSTSPVVVAASPVVVAAYMGVTTPNAPNFANPGRPATGAGVPPATSAPRQ
jgi:hypothetical protein